MTDKQIAAGQLVGAFLSLGEAVIPDSQAMKQTPYLSIR